MVNWVEVEISLSGGLEGIKSTEFHYSVDPNEKSFPKVSTRACSVMVGS